LIERKVGRLRTSIKGKTCKSPREVPIFDRIEDRVSLLEFLAAQINGLDGAHVGDAVERIFIQ
jgi:hypothetical protein